MIYLWISKYVGNKKICVFSCYVRNKICKMLYVLGLVIKMWEACHTSLLFEVKTCIDQIKLDINCKFTTQTYSKSYSG